MINVNARSHRWPPPPGGSARWTTHRRPPGRGTTAWTAGNRAVLIRCANTASCGGAIPNPADPAGGSYSGRREIPCRSGNFRRDCFQCYEVINRKPHGTPGPPRRLTGGGNVGGTMASQRGQWRRVGRVRRAAPGDLRSAPPIRSGPVRPKRPGAGPTIAAIRGNAGPFWSALFGDRNSRRSPVAETSVCICTASAVSDPPPTQVCRTEPDSRAAGVTEQVSGIKALDHTALASLRERA